MLDMRVTPPEWFAHIQLVNKASVQVVGSSPA